MGSAGKNQAIEKMRTAGVTPAAIEVFAHYYDLVESGASGMTPEDSIEPIKSLPRLVELETDEEAAVEALQRTVVIKLNGGLGTSMGMEGPKSLLEARPGRTFLDLIAGQVLALRRKFDISLPLVFMNSFRTRNDTLAALEEYSELPVEGLPLDFLQNREPKLAADDLTPISWPPDPDLEWCPPGHGDLYTAITGSGVLESLIDLGFRYAFVSNADNLGALVDPRLISWFASSGAPFASESCRRTPSDRKGGHLAVRRSDKRLILRETAQTLPEDMEDFTDIDRHHYFNTNNLWLDLNALAVKLDETDGVLGLPLIRNVKNVNPSQPESPKVIQIETAMGAAIEVFDGSLAIEVDRSRFLPVKTTNELLALRSDAYEVDDEDRVHLVDGRTTPPHIDLDDVYTLVSDFDYRFPSGPPSLATADSLVVDGDWIFGADVRVDGSVVVEPPHEAQGVIPDGTLLSG